MKSLNWLSIPKGEPSFPEQLRLLVISLLSETVLRFGSLPESVSECTDIPEDNDEAAELDREILLIWRTNGYSGPWVNAIISSSRIQVIKKNDFTDYVYEDPTAQMSRIADEIHAFLTCPTSQTVDPPN